MDAKLLTLYFVLGGTIVTLISYFGTQGRGMLAAFRFFPQHKHRNTVHNIL